MKPLALQIAGGMALAIPACSHTHDIISHPKPTYGAVIMRNDRDHRIGSKQFPVRILSLSTPHFQHPQKVSNARRMVYARSLNSQGQSGPRVLNSSPNLKAARTGGL